MSTFKPSLEFEKISIDEARKNIDMIVRPQVANDWSRARAPQPRNALETATIQWMAGLPYEMRPRELSRQFPRIANRLCELWKRPAQCDPYFKELLVDNRGARKGFPMAVAMELSTLADHYATIYPYRGTVWTQMTKIR
jgi:hypothetical protein